MITISVLLWLKSNNQYYENINIDYEIVQSLPENGSIIDLLPQIHTDLPGEEVSIDDEANEETISSTFVASITPTTRETTAISNTLNQIQSNDTPIMWPEIDGTPINEFQTPGYIARAFPTLSIWKSRSTVRSNLGYKTCRIL